MTTYSNATEGEHIDMISHALIHDQIDVARALMRQIHPDARLFVMIKLARAATLYQYYNSFEIAAKAEFMK